MLLGLALLLSLCGSAFAASPSAASPLDETIEGLLGIRYKYGGTDSSGFDCSGFTSYVFAAHGIDLPRDSRSQAGEGVKIAKNELRKGDLVFFKTNGKSISHVGIYIGDGKMAHASTKQGTIITDINSGYYAKRYVTARRILTDEQYQALAMGPAPSADFAVQPEIGQAVAQQETEASSKEEAEVDIEAPVTAIE